MSLALIVCFKCSAGTCFCLHLLGKITESLMWHWSLKSESVDLTDSVIFIIVLFLIYSCTFQTSNGYERPRVLSYVLLSSSAL